MSESNQVTLRRVPETTYGVTPVSTNWTDMRYTDETLSATPNTVTSSEIRSDRMLSDQLKTGLTVGGGINIEFSPTTYDLELQAAMHSLWTANVLTIGTTDYSFSLEKVYEDVGKQIRFNGMRVGQFTLNMAYGEILTGSIAYMGNRYVTDTTDFQATATDSLTIGTGPHSLTGVVGKNFAVGDTIKVAETADPDTNSMTGEITAYNSTTGALDFTALSIAGSGTISAWTISVVPVDTTLRTAATTTGILNASSDIGTVKIDNVETSICINSLSIDINNNMRDINCIGNDAPVDVKKGTATVSGSAEIYMDAASWDLYKNVLSQSSVSLEYTVDDGTNSYTFLLPNVKLSGETPNSTGLDSDVFVSVSYNALYDAGEGTSLKITRT